MKPASLVASELTRPGALSPLRLVVAAGFCWSCAASEPGTRAPAAPAGPEAPSVPAIALRDAGWGRAGVESLALSLELPDSAAWRDAGGRDWRRLEHRASHTLLAITRFRAPASVAARECAAQAGLTLGSTTGTDDGGELEVRSIEGAHGTHSVLSVRVEPDGPGALRGELEAATAGFRACAALRLETRVDGDGREVELARRLALFADGVLPSLAFDRVEDRVQKKSDPIGL